MIVISIHIFISPSPFVLLSPTRLCNVYFIVQLNEVGFADNFSEFRIINQLGVVWLFINVWKINLKLQVL